MSSSFTIQLQNLRFFAEHGMYEEEKSAGNAFEVNLSIEIRAPKQKLISLEQTINYAEVFRITQAIFSKRKYLLETLAMEIADALKTQFPAIKKIAVQIRKLNPPITSFTGSVSVSYERTFKKKGK